MVFYEKFKIMMVKSFMDANSSTKVGAPYHGFVNVWCA